MQRLLVSVLSSCAFFLMSSSGVFAEQMCVTTYYPSPNGSYDALSVKRLSVGDTNGDGNVNASDAPSSRGYLLVEDRVGIGTNAPNWPLEIRAGTSDRVVIGGTNVGNVNTNSPKLSFYGSGGSTGIIGPSIQKINTGSYGSGRLAFLQHNTGDYTNETEVLSILSNGNVGIGTTAPAQKLHILGRLTIDSGASGNCANHSLVNIWRTKSSCSCGDTTSGIGHNIYQQDDQSWYSNDLCCSHQAIKFGNDGMHFISIGSVGSCNAGTMASPADAMFISTSGNVGIGTTNPTAKLEVIGNLLGAAKGPSGEALRIAAGRTTPGSTNWVQYSTNGIYVDVDTSSAGFTSTPYYFTSIGGTSSHWTATGATSIYSATRTGFRIYVSATGITAAQANSWQWHINWCGIGN